MKFEGQTRICVDKLNFFVSFLHTQKHHQSTFTKKYPLKSSLLSAVCRNQCWQNKNMKTTVLYHYHRPERRNGPCRTFNTKHCAITSAIYSLVCCLNFILIVTVINFFFSCKYRTFQFLSCYCIHGKLMWILESLKYLGMYIMEFK